MIVTPHLILRPWRASDLEPFAQQNAGPEATRFLNGVFTRAQSDACVAPIGQHLAEGNPVRRHILYRLAQP